MPPSQQGAVYPGKGKQNFRFQFFRKFSDTNKPHT